MEFKINKEIRNYTESIFFGLSFRQLIFAILACAVAVGLYFLCQPHFGISTLSWICILGAAPFAALGFFSYNGLKAEEFLWAWLKSEVIEPKRMVFRAESVYYAALKGKLTAKKKEEMHND